MPQRRHLSTTCAYALLECGKEVARRFTECDKPFANSICPNQQHIRPTSKRTLEFYVASPGSVPVHGSLEVAISKRRATARTSLKNWNKSVCSNRAESLSQRWTAKLRTPSSKLGDLTLGCHFSREIDKPG